jgi:hypothetical protein
VQNRKSVKGLDKKVGNRRTHKLARLFMFLMICSLIPAENSFSESDLTNRKLLARHTKAINMLRILTYRVMRKVSFEKARGTAPLKEFRARSLKGKDEA